MLKKPLPGPARLMLGAGLAVFASSAAATALWQQQPATLVTLPAITVATAVAPLPPLAVDATRPTRAPMALAPRATPVSARAPVARGPGVSAVPAPRAPVSPNPFIQEPAPLPPPPLPRGEAPVAPAPEIAPAPQAVEVADYQAPRVLFAKPARIPSLADIPAGSVITNGLIMRVSLDIAGEPVDVQVHDTHLGRIYQRNAIAAVKRWKFAPALAGGQPVPATVLVPVAFGGVSGAGTNFHAEEVSHPTPTYMPRPQHVATPDSGAPQLARSQ